MTGDRIKIFLLNLPFMLRDLVLPEVFMRSSIYIISTYQHIVYYIVYDNVTTSYAISSFPLKVLVRLGQGCRREAKGARSRIKA